MQHRERRRVRRATLFLTAVVVDLALGDPPSVVHPTAWVGRALAAVERLGRRTGPLGQLLFGSACAVLLPMGLWMGVRGLLRAAGRRSRAAAFVLEIALLKSTFAVRSLLTEALSLRRLLIIGDLEGAREKARSLVSRDTTALDERLLVSAGLESLAENVTDSFLAPWLYYLLFGTEGAIAYRAANTLDSMWGYHREYEHLGKAGARLDDVLNLVPARVGAALLAGACALWTGRGGRAWEMSWSQHRRTESPNAGWTMAAMAGGLGVELETPGRYRLGSPDRKLEANVIFEGVRIVATVAAVAALITGVAALAVRDGHGNA
jgi:adenosylcobinamide-phosphate synthase